MELNAKEIIKALECCASSNGIGACESGCPLWEIEPCPCIDEPNEILHCALALIEQLTQAHEMLSESYDALEKTKDELLAERSRLTDEVADLKAIAEQYQKQFEDCYEEKVKLTEENEAWQKQLISAEEKSGKAYYDLACEVEDLRADNENLHASCTEFERKCASLNDENERLRAENVDCRLGFTLLEDAFQRLEKINEQTKADTVREMQERIKEYFPYDADSGLYVVLDQIAKELISDE